MDQVGFGHVRSRYFIFGGSGLVRSVSVGSGWVGSRNSSTLRILPASTSHDATSGGFGDAAAEMVVVLAASS